MNRDKEPVPYFELMTIIREVYEQARLIPTGAKTVEELLVHYRGTVDLIKKKIEELF